MIGCKPSPELSTAQSRMVSNYKTKTVQWPIYNVASCLVAGFYSPINQTDSPQDESHIQNASTPVKNASLLTVVGTTRSKLQSSMWHPPTRHWKVRLGLGVSTRSAANTVKARTVMYHLSHSFHLHLDRYIFGRFFMIYSTSRSECFKTIRSKHQ